MAIWRTCRERRPWQPYSSLMMRNQSAPSSAPSWKGASHQVLEASNGRHGLELYRERSADLIITDIGMPEMNGLAMMLVLKRTFLNVKVIAMSGGVESE